MLINRNTIEALYSLGSDEIEILLLKSPESIKDLIDSTFIALPKYDSSSSDMKKHIIRLALVSSTCIGGVAVYVPYPTRSSIKLFVNRLAELALQNNKVTLNDIVNISSNPNKLENKKWPVYLHMFIQSIQNELQCINLTMNDKCILTKGFIKSFLDSFSGRARHLPSGVGVLALLRSKIICKKFTGNNINELSWQYGVSAATIYSYIREERVTKRCVINNVL